MKCVEIPRGGRYGEIKGMDPRADWLLGPGREDYLPDPKTTLIPFIMSLNSARALDVVRGLLERPPLYISSRYARKMAIGRHFPAFAPLTFFEELVKEDGIYAALRDAPKEIKLCLPQPSSQPHWTPGEPVAPLDHPSLTAPASEWPCDTVVIGVIDDGIAFGNQRFLDAAGNTRVQCFWRQDGPNHSTTVEFGTEICKRDGPGGQSGIDSLLTQSRVGGTVDEEAFYRSAGLIDFAQPEHQTAAWRASHGTHVLDIAAGENPACDVRNRPIVCVQLDPALVEDTSLSNLEDKVLHAIDYVLERADNMAGGGDPLPVVINFSFGNIAGPHDGTSSLERSIEERLADHPDRLRVVFPAGNSHLSRCHAQFAFTATDEVVELPWRVQPDDTTASCMEIWLPHEGPDVPDAARMMLSVRAPDGTETSLLGETHSTCVDIENNGEVVCAAQYLFMPFPTERGVFVITLQPTTRPYPTETPALRDKIAPSGVWTIRLHNVALANTDTVRAWIQRDDRVFSYPRRGRQSYFDDPCYVRFDSKGREVEDDGHPEQGPCAVKRQSLVNAIATGERTIVAGAFVRNNFLPARYSAGEPITPTRDESLNDAFRKPDATLVGDDSKVHAGILAAGSRSGSVVNFSGTSVAAPQLTRWIATELGARRAGDRDAVKAKAQTEEAVHPVATPALAPERGGWGRIELPPVVPFTRSLKTVR